MKRMGWAEGGMSTLSSDGCGEKGRKKDRPPPLSARHSLKRVSSKILQSLFCECEVLRAIPHPTPLPVRETLRLPKLSILKKKTNFEKPTRF